MRFIITNYHIYRADCFRGRKGGIATAVGKGILLNHEDLSPLASAEATGICMSICNCEVLIAAVYKFSGCAQVITPFPLEMS